MKELELTSDRSVSQIIMGCHRELPSEDLLDYAYEQGIRFFDVDTKYPSIESFLGQWAKKNYYKDIVFSTHGEYRKNIVDVVKDSRDRLDTQSLIFHIAHSDPSINIMDELNALSGMSNSRAILGYGLRTHSIQVIRKSINTKLTTLQIPANIFENGFFTTAEKFTSETDVKIIGIKIFGSGLYSDLENFPSDFILKSAVSMNRNNFICIGFKSLQEIDHCIASLNEVDDSMYPVVNSVCNNCQICNDVCMNSYNLSKLVKYCMYMDSNKEELSAWGKNKLSLNNPNFECIQCRLCMDNCPLRLQVRDYIAEHLAI